MMVKVYRGDGVWRLFPEVIGLDYSSSFVAVKTVDEMLFWLKANQVDEEAEGLSTIDWWRLLDGVPLPLRTDETQRKTFRELYLDAAGEPGATAVDMQSVSRLIEDWKSVSYEIVGDGPPDFIEELMEKYDDVPPGNAMVESVFFKWVKFEQANGHVVHVIFKSGDIILMNDQGDTVERLK